MVLNDPLLEGLKDDPEYQKILQRGIDKEKKYSVALAEELKIYEEEKGLKFEMER